MAWRPDPETMREKLTSLDDYRDQILAQTSHVFLRDYHLSRTTSSPERAELELKLADFIEDIERHIHHFREDTRMITEENMTALYESQGADQQTATAKAKAKLGIFVDGYLELEHRLANLMTEFAEIIGKHKEDEDEELKNGADLWHYFTHNNCVVGDLIRHANILKEKFLPFAACAECERQCVDVIVGRSRAADEKLREVRGVLEGLSSRQVTLMYLGFEAVYCDAQMRALDEIGKWEGWLFDREAEAGELRVFVKEVGATLRFDD